MDPISPIPPVTPRIGAVAPLPSTRRVDPDPGRDRGRQGARDEQRGRRDSDSDEPDTTRHIDISA